MSTDTPKRGFPLPLLIRAVLSIVVIGALGWVGVEWTVNHIYVHEGQSLLLRYKGSPIPFMPGRLPMAAKGKFAKVDERGGPAEIGILEQMVGPGRHFYSPLWWERTRVDDIIVEPNQVAIATSKMGSPMPKGQFLVDGDLGSTKHKGILRKAFGPGRYRVNSYAYAFKIIQGDTGGKNAVAGSGRTTKHAGWVEIPIGYVGVVTNLTDNPITKAKSGIQEHVLSPGIYPVNPEEQQIDIVEIGFREKSITATLKLDPQGDFVLDESGEPMIADEDSGISFPSNDGFNIQMDFTAIWGITPDQAPDVIRKFPDVEAVENRVVVPQIESICRNMGSKLGAVELLVGESRQKFQEDTSVAFKNVLQEEDITLLYGLVRHIYIPQKIRLPIQEAFIADEVKLTLEQQQETTRTEALLKEAMARVELESQRVRVETEKDVAKALAEGEKTAEETKAETIQMVAAIDKKTAELDAQASIQLGEAEAGAEKVLAEANADKFRLAVQAFGTGDAYNQWVFASGLPEDMELKLLYAGEGTFWTDLKGFSDVMLGGLVKESLSQRRAAPRRRRPSQ